MKKVILSALFLSFFTGSAHAELQLSNAEIHAKGLRLCRNLQSGIEDVSELVNHYSAIGNLVARDRYVGLHSELMTNFRDLECDRIIDQASKAKAELSKKCQSFEERINVLSDRYLAALVRLSAEERDEYYRQRAVLVNQAKRIGCSMSGF